MSDDGPDLPMAERRRFLKGLSLTGAAALTPAGLTAATEPAPHPCIPAFAAWSAPHEGHCACAAP